MPPTPQPTVDHGGVRIGADQRVRVQHALLVTQHATGKVFEIDLMHDADRRGNDAQRLERRLAPAQELVTLPVALEFEPDVLAQRLGRTGKVHLHRVVDHQVHRHQRLDLLRILAGRRHGAAQCRQVHHAGHASEVLQDHSPRNERHLGIRIAAAPGQQGLDVVRLDRRVILVAQRRFQQHPHRIRQAAWVAEAQFGQRRQAVIGGRLATGEGKRAAGSGERGLTHDDSED